MRHGPKPIIRLPRWREGKDGLEIEVGYGSSWSFQTESCLGVKLLWQVERVLLDGKPIEVPPSLNTGPGECRRGTCPVALKAGDHQVVVEVQCAYIDSDKLFGLDAFYLPIDRWPSPQTLEEIRFRASEGIHGQRADRRAGYRRGPDPRAGRRN